MTSKVNLIIGSVCYLVSLFLIGYYLILEFSIIDVTSPLIRLRIIGIVILLMYFGCYFILKIKDDFKFKLTKLNMIVWFSLYIIMLLNLTLFDKYFGRSGEILYLSDKMTIQSYFETNFNIIPFETIDNYFLAIKNNNLLMENFLYNIAGNILAFMPFAFFLPRLFKKVDCFYKFFLLVSLFILLIEVLQMITMSGSFDIDDYILNILGASLFYGIINNTFLRKYIDKIIYFQ